MAEDVCTRPATAPTSYVFIVEVWCEASSFRATARRVGEELAHCFDERAGLITYLCSAADGAHACTAKELSQDARIRIQG